MLSLFHLIYLLPTDDDVVSHRITSQIGVPLHNATSDTPLSRAESNRVTTSE